LLVPRAVIASGNTQRARSAESRLQHHLLDRALLQRIARTQSCQLGNLSS
jgi:hypothetical protein